MNVHRNTSRSVRLALGLAISLAACGGSPGTHDGRRVLPTNGSTMVLTPDDEIAVSVQREANVVSVFHVTTPGVAASLSAPTVLTMPTTAQGQPGEPWAAVIGNDGDTAYVILRRAQLVVQITDLHGTPTIAAQAATGSEPTGIAITPNGHTLYIANWNEGTLTRVQTADMGVTDIIDLNAALAGSGLLGNGVTPRPALAHPRGIVITDHGHGRDEEETAYVTEFFSQARTDAVPIDHDSPDAAADLPRYDVARQGVVYAVDLGTRAVSIMTILPVARTGMLDSNGVDTGCIPNQLQAPTLHGSDLFIASVCASPQGPTDEVAGAGTDSPDTRNFTTIMQPVIFVVDTTTNTEITAERRVLSSEFMALYRGLPHGFDDSPDPNNIGFTCDGAHSRIPLIPTDITFAPGGKEFYVTAYGSNAVFRVGLAHDGTPANVGGGMFNYVELVVNESSPGTGANVGRLPTGMAIGVQHTDMALVSNDNTRNVSLVDLTSQAATGSFTAAPLPITPEETRQQQARMFFVTGTGRWAFHAQGWSSCEGCHPDGLSDNVTWFFKRGPRQTPSLAGTYGNGGERRLMSWTASFDEIQDLESITRGLQGGVGSFVHQANTTPSATGITPAATNDDRLDFAAGPLGTPVGLHRTTEAADFLNGSSASVSSGESVLHFYDFIRTYVAGIRAPRRPTGLSATAVQQGHDVFVARGCAGCHGSAQWTVSRVGYQPGPMTAQLRTTSYSIPAGFPPALNPVADGGTATFRYPDPATAQTSDQINCALRAVGTFGVAPMVQGRPQVLVNEIRHNMVATAQGDQGFNPPAIIGMSAGAPYFHAGNARTLEEMILDPAFDAHARAFQTAANTAPLTASDPDTTALVTYLVAIDDETRPVDLPSSSNGFAPLGFDPDLCGSFGH